MSDNSKKAEELKEQGNQAFAVKNYEKAISLYTEAIKLDPNNHVFFSNRSASYGGQSKWKLAEEDAKECIRLEPSFVKGYYRLATAQVELGDYDGAAATVRQGLTVDPNNPQLMKQLRAIKKAAKEKASGVGASATKAPRALDAATTRELQDLQLQFAQTAAGHEEPGAAHQNADDIAESSGWSLTLDQDVNVIPSTLTCHYCNKEGKTHPREHFVSYPCCGYKICRDCMSENAAFCGECITDIPKGNEHAISWLYDRLESGTSVCDQDHFLHMLGRVFVLGSGMFMDELIHIPLYQRLQPPPSILAILSPPMVQKGVMYLEEAAKCGRIAAMLDLAHVYNTNFTNDLFQKDKKKAEYWHQRAIGQGNHVFPLALTCYGEFLKWEPSKRHAQARSMFQMAAEFGHARGQYEYAMCLLGGIGKDVKEEKNEEHVCTNEEMEEAIKWLCRASEHGHYAPSYVQLAKVLIETFEKEYGTASLSGMSPLPRALQVLSLVKDGRYGNSESVRKEAAGLLERYDSCQTRCASCGNCGSENNPLSRCATCGVVSYCSRICARKDFRDGHKFDCCSRAKLFDFHFIKMRLPWTKDLSSRDVESVQPSLHGSKRRTLMEMVEDDTDEVYGEQEMQYDEHLLTQLMLRMRINLETFLESESHDGNHAVQSSGATEDRAGASRNLTLNRRIEAFSKYSSANQDFIMAMHKIRVLGNNAAHLSTDNKPGLSQEECENAVRDYRRHKEKYEINKLRKLPVTKYPPSSPPEMEQGASANAAGITSLKGSSPLDQSDGKSKGDTLSASTEMTTSAPRAEGPMARKKQQNQGKKGKKKRRNKKN